VTTPTDQAIRGLVTVALCVGFLYGFWAGKISGEVFTAVFSGIVGLWFAARPATADVVKPTPPPQGGS